jgi:NAD-specific glutamate dehydrogenase
MPSALILVKADARSTVHRLGVPRLHRRGSSAMRAGNIVGLRASSSACIHGARLSRIDDRDSRSCGGKITAVSAKLRLFTAQSPDKTLLNVLETYPRDELIEIARGSICMAHCAAALFLCTNASRCASSCATMHLGALRLGDGLHAARPFRYDHTQAHKHRCSVIR